MHGRWLQVPVKTFFEAFEIQSPDDQRLTSVLRDVAALPAEDLSIATSESTIYSYFTEVIQICFRPTPEQANGLVVKETASHPDYSHSLSADSESNSQHIIADASEEAESDYDVQGDFDNLKNPGVSIYPTTCYNPNPYYELTDKEKEASKIAPLPVTIGRTSWTEMCVYVEVKAEQTWKAFGMLPQDRKFIVDSDGGRSARVQLVQYAGEIFLHQHRTWVYSLYVWRNYVRLIRWDRAGATVSQPIDYVKEPRYLVSFFLALADMGLAARGYDPSATMTTKGDSLDSLWRAESEAKMKSQPGSALGELLQRANKYDWWPVHQLTVTGDVKTDGGSTKIAKTYLVKRHECGYRSPTGRGSRTYIALDVETKEFRVLRDMWQNVECRSELKTLDLLHDAGVPGIPTDLIGGAVRLQEPGTQHAAISTTTTHLVQARLGLPSDNQSQIVTFEERHHIRFTMKEIGYRLKDYRNSRELVMVIRDAILAHGQAWTKAEILHRDISDNNILIIRDGGDQPAKGLLIDWDLAKKASELSEPVSNGPQSGTWRFRSSLSVRYPPKPYDYSDDLESFAYILTICGLRFHAHGLQPGSLAARFINYFDDYSVSNRGFYIGADEKDRLILRLARRLEMWSSNSNAFVMLLHALSTQFAFPEDALVLLDAFDPLLQDYAEDVLNMPGPPPPVATTLTWEEFVKTKRPKHSDILALFTKAIENASEWKDDKLADQFLGIPGLARSAVSEMPKVVTKRGKGSGNDMDDDSDDESQPKKAKYV